MKTQFGLYLVLSYLILHSIFLDLLKKYLDDQLKTVQYRDQMDRVATTIEVEKNGSETLQYIYLLVCLKCK